MPETEQSSSEGISTTEAKSKYETSTRSRKRHKSRRSSSLKTEEVKEAGKRPYPRVSLENALLVAKAIKEKNGGNSWSAEQIANVLGLSAKSGSFRYYLLGSKKFGLTDGTNPDGQVSLTELGRQIVYGGSPEEEHKGKVKAFLNVEIFKQVYEHYNGSKLPEMQYLGNTLKSKFYLPEAFHEEFSTLFRQNADYLGLDSGVTNVSKAIGARLATSEVVVLGEPKNDSGLVCFVIMPFIEKTDAYAQGFFDEVLNSLIIPAGREAGFEVKTANRQGTEMIHSTIVNEILDADMCVCDLTEHNPNVLFELGMRLAHDKPVALIQAEGTARVFDVDNVLRVLAYKKELWRTTIQKDLPDLTAHIKATWENREVSESYIRILRSSKPKARAIAAVA